MNIGKKLFLFIILAFLVRINDTRGPRLIRFSVKYVPCKERYIIEGKEFYGCNLMKTPTGKDPKAPWCMLNEEFFEKGDWIWDYCYQEPDFDEFRFYYGEIRNEELKNWGNLESKAAELLSVVTQTLAKIEDTKKSNAKKDEVLSQTEKKLEEYRNIIISLGAMKDNLIAADQNMKRTKMLKEANEPDVTPPIDPFNCSAFSGYENKMFGNGLKAFFYPNDKFEGQPLLKEVENVKFYWVNEDPVPSIHMEDFSLHIKGWIRVPVTSKYAFRIETEESFSVFINKQPIISHYIGLNKTIHGGKEPLELMRETISLRKSPVYQPQTIGFGESFDIFMSAENLYEIEIFYYRSIPDKLIVKDLAFLKLYWKNEFYDYKIIDERFLFRNFVFQPLRADKPKEALSLPKCFIAPNTQAFIDSEEYILVDVPQSYTGYDCIRQKEKPESSELIFPLSQSSIIYIAIPSDLDEIMPKNFAFTQTFMSVRKKDGSSNKRFHVYSAKYTAFNVTIILNKAVQAVAFFTRNPEISPFSCGGVDVVLTDKQKKAFDKCEVSSKLTGKGFSCLNALSGDFQDSSGTVWATDKGVGSYMDLFFKQEYQVNEMEIMTRDDPLDRVKLLDVSFGPGNEQKIVELKNNPNVQKFSIDPPVVTTTMRFTIKDVGTSRNNGFALRVTGNGCMKKKDTKMVFDQINLTCTDNFVNKYDFTRMKLLPQMKFSFNCMKPCKYTPTLVFGNPGGYSYDSSICKAAIHANVLKTGVGLLTVTLQEGKGYYPSAKQNGVRSIARGPASFTFIIASRTIDLLEPLIVTKLVDIKDDLEGMWKTGKVLKKKVEKRGVMIQVEIKNSDETTRKELVNWPNPTKVLFCGEKVSDAPCTKNDVSAQGPLFIDLKINFGPASAKIPAFLLDTGQPFQKMKLYEFGWTRDMRDMARKRYKNPDPLMDSMVLFNPDGNSMWCSKMRSFSSCEQVEWMIKVPNGKYAVKVTIGDSEFRAKYDLQINGEQFVSRILEIGSYIYPSINIFVSNGYIKLSSRCFVACTFSWTRINAIQIQKLDCKNSLKPDNLPPFFEDETQAMKKTINIGCGYAGGRCEKEEAENCVYDSLSSPGLERCIGRLMLVKIPLRKKCANKFKCIRSQYEDKNECKKHCPGNCSKELRCTVI